jgi:hypothetical protein
VNASLSPFGYQSTSNSSTRPVFVRFVRSEPSAFIKKMSELLTNLE